MGKGRGNRRCEGREKGGRDISHPFNSTFTTYPHPVLSETCVIKN